MSRAFTSRIPELQRSASLVFAMVSSHPGWIEPARHHLPKAPMNQESESIREAEGSSFAEFDDVPEEAFRPGARAPEDRAWVFVVGTIAAIVIIPKVRKTCLGVRRDTEARLTK